MEIVLVNIARRGDEQLSWIEDSYGLITFCTLSAMIVKFLSTRALFSSFILHYIYFFWHSSTILQELKLKFMKNVSLHPSGAFISIFLRQRGDHNWFMFLRLYANLSLTRKGSKLHIFTFFTFSRRWASKRSGKQVHKIIKVSHWVFNFVLIESSYGTSPSLSPPHTHLAAVKRTG